MKIVEWIDSSITLFPGNNWILITLAVWLVIRGILSLWGYAKLVKKIR